VKIKKSVRIMTFRKLYFLQHKTQHFLFLTHIILPIFLYQYIIMNRFNNLFPTHETTDMVKEYIRTNVIPPDIHSQYHFRQKYKHFKLNNDDE